MKLVIKIAAVMLLGTTAAAAQENIFSRLEFLLGSWSGTGRGFGNSTSVISADYRQIMDGTYIQVSHDSRFEPGQGEETGEHHTDMGLISYDKAREAIIYRQFNNEGYVNRYVLIDSLSGKDRLVFETEAIENFVPGGTARFTVRRIGADEIETVFDVSFPGREYACFGTNNLRRN